MVVVSEAKTRKNYKCWIFWDLVVFSNVVRRPGGEKITSVRFSGT